MNWMQTLGQNLNPYASMLPASVQKNAQMNAARNFLGGMAAKLAAAGGPTPYPVPLGSAIASAIPAGIGAAQTAQNTALANALNAQKLQALSAKNKMLQNLMGGTPTKPLRSSVNFDSLSPNLGVTPSQNPYGDFQGNPGQTQQVPTSVALPAAMARVGVPAPAIPQNGITAPGGSFNMLSGQMNAADRQQAIIAEVAGLPGYARYLYERGKPTNKERNIAAYNAMPDMVTGPGGTQVPNQAKAMMKRAIIPARRVIPPAETQSVNTNYSSIKDLQTNMRNNRGILNVLDAQEAFISSTDKAAMGPGSRFIGRLKDFADKFFGENNRISVGLGSVAPANVRGAMDSLFTDMMFTQTKKLKGAISEKEMTAAGKVGPSIDDPKESALAKIKVQRILLEKSEKVGAELQRRIREMGAKKWNETIQTNPFFIDNLIIEVGKQFDVTAAIQGVIADANKVGSGSQPVIRTVPGTGGG